MRMPCGRFEPSVPTSLRDLILYVRPKRAGMSRWFRHPCKKLRQDSGVVHHRITCCVKQRDILLFRAAEQLLNHFCIMSQLIPVLLPKGVESRGIMGKPSSEVRARRDVLEPKIEVCSLPRNSSRSQPIDEHTAAIVWFRCGIDPLDMDHTHQLPLPGLCPIQAGGSLAGKDSIEASSISSMSSPLATS